MVRARLLLLISIIVVEPAAQATADPLSSQVGTTTYIVDPTTLKIDARPDSGEMVAVMPPLHAPETPLVIADGSGWHWIDAEDRLVTVSTDGAALRLTISQAARSILTWSLPPATTGTWLIPDGEGMAYNADDSFWRSAFKGEECLAATSTLSFPAWSYLNSNYAVTYALGDGLLSKLCLHDNAGVQARLTHDFKPGTETLDLLFSLEPANPLAPALFYRRLLKQRGQLKSFADKAVPKLARLFGSPQVYVWGDGRDLSFLDQLHALGIRRIVLSYDQDPRMRKHLVGPAYLAKADKLGYLSGPYEAFSNGQPKKTAEGLYAIWSDDLFPSGCLRDAHGKIVPGFAHLGCEMSSEATAGHPEAPSPASRYAGHVRNGATEVFLDVDAFGEFYEDFSPDHPMTEARDRTNRLNRMALASERFQLVLGSENVTAWSAAVTHYSHGTAEAHVSPLWAMQNDKTRFGAYWPADRPPFYFTPILLTPAETRMLFGPADRLPLFEAVFHDSVVAADRWEFGMMKVVGEERQRFARSLLYGTPTMWHLDRRELIRVGAWLKAAQDDFYAAHGSATPVPLTGFTWLTPDHLVQRTTYADGRVLTANFGQVPWQGLGSACVRVTTATTPTQDLCPPVDPLSYN